MVEEIEARKKLIHITVIIPSVIIPTVTAILPIESLLKA